MIFTLIQPYVHEYRTSVKGRWLKREILEVLTSEFGGHSPNYWVNAINAGRVRINEKTVNTDYIFQNNGNLRLHIDRLISEITGFVLLLRYLGSQDPSPRASCAGRNRTRW